MLIRQFRARKAHGYLDLRVAFHSDLTFLTGINGSGKTTVVRGIVALLKPSFQSLAGMQYDELSVTVEDTRGLVTVSATRNDDHFMVTSPHIDTPLSIAIYKQAEYESPARFRELESDFYREQHTLNAQHPLLTLLSSLPTPMYLDLERRGNDSLGRARFIGARPLYRPTRNAFHGSLGQGLAEAQQVAEVAYDTIRAQERKHTERLGRDLILTAFIQGARERVGESLQLPTDEYVARLRLNRELVTKALVNIGIDAPQVGKSVSGFFTTLEEVAKELAGSSLNEILHSPRSPEFEKLSRWIALQPQEKQIARIVELVERFNRRIDDLRAPINRYLDSINRFLSDSGKELAFTHPGRLVVRLADGTDTGIAALSSGERQLVVILTHLAFGPETSAAQILIVDEPELSLHVRWQEEFVDAMMQARGQLQLILATHSPSIILDKTAHCVDVAGF